MAQNVYDDPTFLAKFWALTDTIGRVPGGVPDINTLDSLLPPISGSRVLDIGCGDGWFGRWAMTHGAASCHGADRAQSMIARALEATADLDGEVVTFAVADLNEPAGVFGAASRYDLVFSSLAIHYMTDLPALFAEVRKVLRPGGCFFFSVEHPMRTAARKPGMMADADGRRCWPVADYSDEGERVTNWLMEGVIKQHRTLETYFTVLLTAGFEITDFREWAQRDTGNYMNEKWLIPQDVMPAFMMIGARKRVGV